MKLQFALLGAIFLAGASLGAPSAYAAAEPQVAASEAGVVRGVVVDENNEPVIGASVQVVGTTRGTTTAMDGTFSLKAGRGAKVKVTFVGYKSVTLAAKNGMSVKLEQDNTVLDDVVVVGYGQQRKENLTGAVSSVDVNKTLVGRQIPDVGRGLQGSTPGLNITIPNGEVGSDPTIKIRGAIASFEGSTQPLILLDNVEIPSIQIVNPEDIEKISILKDAAASSIYGAKAAFGVVLITTKKGASSHKTSINYSGNFAWEKIAKRMEIAGVDGLRYRVDAMKRAGSSLYGAFWYVNEESLAAAEQWQKDYGGTIGKDDPFVYGRDWYVGNDGRKYSKRIFDPYDYMIREWAPSTSHSLSINGREGKTMFSIGLGYLRQSGLMEPAKHDDFTRYNGSIRVSTELNKYFTARAGANYSWRNKRYAYATSSTTADPWLYLYRWDSTYPLGYDENGHLLRSPYGEVKSANTANKLNTYLSFNAGATVHLTKDWKADVDYTYAQEDQTWNRPGTKYTMANTWGSPVARVDANGNPVYVNSAGEVVDASTEGAIRAYDLNYYQYTSDGANPDHIWRGVTNGRRNTWNVTTDYNWDINDDNNIKFLLGLNTAEYKSEYSWSQITNLTDINNPNFNKTVGTQTTGGSNEWESQVGFFGRVNYNLMHKYLFEANLRRDASSKFPSDMRWRWFPSFSAGWQLGEETFMNWAKPALTSLKIRGSWGKIGDQTVGNSLYYSSMSQGETNWINNGSKMIYVSTPTAVDAHITWQDIITTDIGFDASFWAGRVGVVFDWYSRTTDNMFVPLEGIPLTFGTTAPKGNYGKLRTRGWELEINFNHRFANGLGVNAMFTISDAKTKILDYGVGQDVDGWYNGKTYGEIWGYETDRLYQHDDFVWDADGNMVQTWARNGKEVPEGTPGARQVNKLSDPNGVYQDRFESGKFHFGPGDVKYKDLNGDGNIWYSDVSLEGEYAANSLNNHGDKKVIGNSTPRYEYGFRLGADYRGFDFSIFCQGIGSRKIWGSSFLAIPGFNCGDGAMPEAIAGDYWTEDNTDAFYPAAWNMGGSDTGYNMQKQTRYLLNMAYLRIKNITLGYTLPASLTRKVLMTKARVYVAMENFFTFDNLRGLPIDPEVVSGVSMWNSSNYNSGRTGVGMPAMKNMSVGIQLNF